MDMAGEINLHLHSYISHYIRKNSLEVSDDMFSLITEGGVSRLGEWKYQIKPPTPSDLLEYSLRDVLKSAEEEKMRRAREQFRASPLCALVRELVKEIVDHEVIAAKRSEAEGMSNKN